MKFNAEVVQGRSGKFRHFHDFFKNRMFSTPFPFRKVGPCNSRGFSVRQRQKDTGIPHGPAAKVSGFLNGPTKNHGPFP